MSTQADWTGKINYLRLDAFESPTAESTPAGMSVHIGAIVLCKTMEEAELVQTGWTPEGAVTDYLQYLEDHKPLPQPDPDPEPDPEPEPEISEDPDGESWEIPDLSPWTWVAIAAAIVFIIIILIILF